ncbi:MAG TPA: choice-of-anchor tandem repeat GloVer-containing protein, partial [Gemmataceae bacterium]|nr:choice-of-anchor tandem repeat GloVer-containing protein [Gemmataceae bacterium]
MGQIHRFRQLLLVSCLALPAGPAAAQVVTVTHNFADGPNDGRNPSGSLIQSGSSLFGMTFGGGTAPDGTIFRTNPDGSAFIVLHSFLDGFNDGRNPSGSLVVSGTTVYGMTTFGGSSGNGVVFSMNTNGTGFNIIHRFAGGTTDGSGPLGSLVLSGSTLYG